MATLEMNKQFSLLELTRREFGGNVLEIAKKLQRNSMIKDAPWAEANDKLNDRGVKYDELPTPSHRLIGKGINPTAGKTTPLEERVTLLDDMSVADKVLVEISANPAKTRINEASMHIHGISKQWAEDVIYGDPATDPANIRGFHTRYNSLSLTNVISGGGSGSDLTSLWIVEWDIDEGACFIYPKGSKIGIEHDDLGLDLHVMDDGSKMRGYGDYFACHFGLRIKFDDAVQRIANIETDGVSNTLDYKKIIKSRNQLPNLGEEGNGIIYVNRTLKTQFDELAIDKANAFYTAKDVWGSPVTMFQNMQVRLQEAIIDAESAVE